MKKNKSQYALFRRILGAAILLVGAFSAFGQKEYPIAAIQGDKNTSPYVGQQVKTSGIVTARTRTGFYIQTPDDKVDNNAATSEGILVFTRTEPGAGAAIGNLVSITGTVVEFRPRTEPNTLSITEITMQAGRDLIQVLSKENSLPVPIKLTPEDFRSNVIDQLERFEGMRVMVPELTVVAPTSGRIDNVNDAVSSSGTFYGVVKGLPRPFREPGFDTYEYLFLPEKDRNEFKKAFPKMRVFDANPERIRVESTAQLGSQPINIPAQTELRNVVGVVHYAYRTYSILLDASARPSVASYPRALQMPAPSDRQFTVAGMNIQNFFDDQDDPDIKDEIVTTEAFEKRVRKISLAVRTVLSSPDIIGTMETESLYGLKRIAERINADTEAAGKPNPKYEGFLMKGNDGRGINVGYLVKTSRVKVIETKQVGKDEKFKSPAATDEIFLNDRPSLMLRAEVIDTKSNTVFPITVIVNHLKSFLGYYDAKRKEAVRTKKRLQAEMLAKFINDRQKADPKERIVVVGDFNAFQFSDGIVDVMGTIKGTPAAAGEVINPSPDLVETDLINLVDFIKADQRYSYIYDGNAQVLDHLVISANLSSHAGLFGFARVNADFPATYRTDETRPERFSDHDSPIAYFNLDAKPKP